MIFMDRDYSNLNLDIIPGEGLCLLGQKGCGKTTLMRCISGALKISKGSIRLKDRELSTMTSTEIARRIGFVFQEHSAPFPYSVIEVVAMGRAPHLRLFSAPGATDVKIAD